MHLSLYLHCVKKIGEGLAVQQKLSLGRHWNKSLAWQSGRRFGLLLRSSERVELYALKLVPQSHSSSIDNMKKCCSCCRLFQRGCVYGCADDAGRFGFFCHAALEFLLKGGFHPVSLLVHIESLDTLFLTCGSQHSTGHSSLSRLVQCSSFMAVQGSLHSLRFDQNSRCLHNP